MIPASKCTLHAAIRDEVLLATVAAIFKFLGDIFPAACGVSFADG